MAEYSANVWSASAIAAGSVATVDAVRVAGAYAPRFKMRGRRTSTGATVHWIAYRAVDLTGAQSPYPGDIDPTSIVRE